MKSNVFMLFIGIILSIMLSACTELPDFPPVPVYGNLVITNQTQYDIQVIRFRVSGPESDIWGRNMIKESYLLENKAYLRMPPGMYDFHFESNDVDGFWTFTGVAIEANQDHQLVIP